MIGLKKEERKELERQRRLSPAIGFGSSFAAGMLVFSLGGRWLDSKYEREPLFTLIGIGLGLLYGGWELWKLIAISNQQSKNTGSEEGNPDEP